MHRRPFFLFALLLLILGGAGAAQARELRLVTWNIAWLTLKPTGHPDLPRDVRRRSAADFARLATYAAQLDADVVAIQEIDGEDAAARVFPPDRWGLYLTRERDTQRPGFAVRRGLRVTEHDDLAALDVYAGARHSLRRGADITVEAEGSRLRLLSVHLKAGCRDGHLGPPDDACDTLAEQAGILAGWIAARQREGGAFAVMGDFNRRLDATDAMTRVLTASAPLTGAMFGRGDPCWSRGGGRGRPFIDHILLGGAARGWLRPDSLRVLVYAESDPSARQRLSDHCPAGVTLGLP
ncbi:endonuclease/exonuclease/phosphatase family metal-dependent hydrolase [Humitalea rosea]|uniref:Endonuclease/exonuclease/phosphatase family metal-dependent hydrolase n=1 Tax=Humitalea rosea TaxID=990373 RepID=A0A2W7HVX7_9PROT|nr:endonuclease/exonuclease/phosphatase family protein [Humitalea rosea]PZW38654.1 endonuclease/exonuclease/phosphatase family metal-dependent hydrolase [Humitalea rosea]